MTPKLIGRELEVQPQRTVLEGEIPISSGGPQWCFIRDGIDTSTVLIVADNANDSGENYTCGS